MSCFNKRFFNAIKIILFSVFIVAIFEVSFMLFCNGNMVIDAVLFSTYLSKEPLTSQTTLNYNQHVCDGFIYTMYQDSIDVDVYIDKKVVKKDTLHSEVIYFRKKYYLVPGKHTISIESKKLNASYSYTFCNYLFIEIFLESSDSPPYFWITKHYFPFRRKEI